MALIVHKYGGTSMGSTERIRNVARRVAKWHAAGHQVVVVPSAMSGETNRLLGLAREITRSPRPARTRHDRVDRRAGLGRPARAWRSPRTGDRRRAAMPAGRSRSAPTAPSRRRASRGSTSERVMRDLDAGRVVVITGFQGVDERRTHHDARPRRLRHVGRRHRGRARRPRVPDLHRRRRRLHDRPAHRSRGATAEGRLVRGNARDGVARLEGAADPLGRVRRQVPACRPACCRA